MRGEKKSDNLPRKVTKDKYKTKGVDRLMIKQMAWNTFKKTGNINTFLELKQVSNLEQNMMQNIKAEISYENCKNEGNNNCRT